MTNLVGLHDFAGKALAPVGTWLLDTIAISENPQPHRYQDEAPGREIIGRLNHGYGDAGTLPLNAGVPEFVAKVAAHVAGSSGCRRWVIGNETNLPREWPKMQDGGYQPISPLKYANIYKLCRNAIHALPGHGGDEVLIAAPGPWNNDYKYTGNPEGDWIKYFMDVLAILGNEIDGICLHAYTHGYNTALVTSTAKMNPPFQNRNYEFRTYQDYMAAIPLHLRKLPVYLTEANGNGPWQAVGLMPAMADEINAWNHMGNQPILCLIFYRYTTDDTFNIVGKADVEAEFRQAVDRQYLSPVGSVAPAPAPVDPTPPVGEGTDVPQTAPALIWDTRLDKRGIKLTPYVPKPGELYWKVVRGDYLLEKEHIFVATLDQNGNNRAGVTLRRWWGGGGQGEQDFAVTQITGDIGMANFPMWNAGWAYGLQALGHPSDSLWGMGLGFWENPNMADHLSYRFVFRLVQAPQSAPVPNPEPPDPLDPLPPLNPEPGKERLMWPCKGVIFQHWGERPEEYQKELGIPYHNGTDIAAPAGTDVRAMAEGVVAFVGTDKNYGNYIRLWHEQFGFHTFMAHLQSVDVAAGQKVVQGQVIGKVGSTGNSTGPHCHVEVRLGTRDTYVQGTYGHTQGRVDPETVMYVLNVANLGVAGVVSNAHGFDVTPADPAAPQAVQGMTKEALVKLAEDAAKEFGVDVPLFLRLVEYESSWRADIVSSAGAMGLTQLMPLTWGEWSAKVNAHVVFNPRDNLRTGAAYLAWLIKYYKGNHELAVMSYNMGLGNVDAGVNPKADTKAYVRKVVYNQD